MSLRRVVILHGYTAHPGKHWFGWLREELAPHGVAVEVPALPDTDHPEAAAWTDAAVAALGTVDAETALVGHSLGTITAVRALGRALAEQPDARLGALALVASFVDPVPIYPELDPFTVGLPELGELAARTGRRLVIRSDFDPEVPIELTPAVVAGLAAEELVVPGAQHFCESQGVTTLPALRDWLTA
ncbi:RBBP9/YdeN family alpha/beta hydrolase [Protaetiibacter intestinalis]|uniref:Alpha/beta fold hydrolase n=1 Tax=Protaetiibacter intestinalis TaxID=2419774 RepID=A0A387B2I8_9MICO|nr:alpha/beta fold hydrolase [Protaetiibacter intestinalis]AYF97722.1 alpha/beta fold hydrolase [Protaetiibacter intestinalis]